ncbi:hypothetical protein FOMPIDRAFT_1025072, partial [Fomitopsis schrenkii]
LPFTELHDHEKTEWHALFQEVLSYLTNLQVKLPILTISIPEDSARNMTQAILTCFQQRSFLDGGRPDTRDSRKYMLSLAQVRQLRDNWRMWTATYNKYASDHQQRQANAAQSAQAVPQPQANGTPRTPHVKPAPQAPALHQIQHPDPPPQHLPQIVPPSLPPKRPSQFPASSPVAGPSTFTPPASAATPAA